MKTIALLFLASALVAHADLLDWTSTQGTKPLYGPGVLKVIAPPAEHGLVRCWNAGTRAGYLGFSSGISRSDSTDCSGKAALSVTVE